MVAGGGLANDKERNMPYSHLEQAETGLDTLNKGLSQKLDLTIFRPAAPDEALDTPYATQIPE